MKEFLRKLLLGVICWTAVIGIAGYETYSIMKKEYIRQSEIVRTAREQINFNLDMIKIGVLTGDVESYEKNVAGVKEQIAVIEPMDLLKNEQADYLQVLNEYVELLESKTNLLKEMQDVKADIVAAKDKINEHYGNKDTLSRDKVREAKDRFTGVKIKAENYTEEKALKVVNAVNGILDGVIEKASVLADCIDTCYKDRTIVATDELAEKKESFDHSASGLNTEFETEFDFEKMQNIREGIIKEEKEEENVEAV
jgi:hypothetical protein